LARAAEEERMRDHHQAVSGGGRKQRGCNKEEVQREREKEMCSGANGNRYIDSGTRGRVGLLAARLASSCVCCANADAYIADSGTGN